MLKSKEKIKEQLSHWFFKHHVKTKMDFNGTEQFTIYDLLPKAQKIKIENYTAFEDYELPVLVLRLQAEDFIINTTHRFIGIFNSTIESINYVEFDRHHGFSKPLSHDASLNERRSIKSEGLYVNFEIVKKNKEIITWKIPSGKPGFAFWSVTKKCEFVGRKYIIVNDND